MKKQTEPQEIPGVPNEQQLFKLTEVAAICGINYDHLRRHAREFFDVVPVPSAGKRGAAPRITRASVMRYLRGEAA